MAFEEELRVVKAAVKRASQCVQQARHWVTKRNKADASPVTSADLASQIILVGDILKAFPEASFIAEEDSSAVNESIIAELRELLQCEQVDLSSLKVPFDANGDSFWAIDPIDGTKGFLRVDQEGQYCVCVALLLKEKDNNSWQVKMSVIGCPEIPFKHKNGNEISKGTLFYAVRGEGCFEEPLFTTPSDIAVERRRLVQNKFVAKKDLVLCRSFEPSHSNRAFGEKVLKCLGSSVPPISIDGQGKYALIARSQAHLYLRISPQGIDHKDKLWDHAPGSLLVEESGGCICSVADASPIHFSDTPFIQHNGGIAVCGAAVDYHELLDSYHKDI